MNAIPSLAFRLPLALLLVAALLAAPGCKESAPDQLFEPDITTFFAASATPSAPDLVRLRGERIDNQTILLDVVLTGPTTSADLYSFAFDLVFSGEITPLYVSGSAEAGPALTASAGQTIDVQAAQSGDRITIGVTKTGGGSGNGVGSGEHVVVSLRLTLSSAGRAEIAFAGDPQGSGPAALDAAGAVIPSISFDPLPATVVRQL